MNWADYNFWADDGYFEQQMATARTIIADRSWNASTTPDTVQDFRTLVARLGDPPGLRPDPVTPRVPLPLRSIGTEKAGLRGDLDEVSTWDEALSPEQVRADYAHYDR
ncbi:hypothetical protein ACFU8Q_25385 [Streptomyces sp. NPDC057543]|uniref:hypothetical protein n=1 Tax=Streptomyces sp. NPDC057543 TaxID=3346163 RepID=UPI003678947D